MGDMRQAGTWLQRLANMALIHALRYPLIVLGVLVLAVPAVVVASSSQEECDASCPADLVPPTSLYTSGASAQTYKAGAPIKTTICDTNDESKQKTKYRVARWPLSRRSYPSPPVVKIVAKIHSCFATGTNTNTCASNPADKSPLTVEAWHARPDGTYSSLRSGVEEGECRSTIDVREDGSFQIETLAPGSVGIFSGIGPRGMDLPPYGPPVINFFIRSQGHSPLLVNIPVSAKSFYGPDLRGPVMVGSRDGKGGTSAQISSWNVEENGDISLSIDFFLAARSGDGSIDDFTSLSEMFCNSWFHGTPASFFLEPIAVCAPSILDFFEL